MEKLTSLNLSFDRVLMQLVLPGAIAAFPFLSLYFDRQPDVYKVLTQDSITYLVTFCLFISLLVGFGIEGIGSRLEVFRFDKCLKTKFPEFNSTWEKYLQLSYKNDPIGQRYLRNIVFRMKLELSMALSLICLNLGMICYERYYTVFFDKLLNISILHIIPAFASIYLYQEAWASAKVLHNTRKLLVDKYYPLIDET